MSDKDVRVYLLDILNEIENSTSFTGHLRSEEEFSKDRRAAYAVARSLEILGEAAKKVPNAFRNSHPDVAWKEMAGMRDKLIHDYANTRASVIWSTVKNDLPKLKEQLEKLLKETGNE